MVVGIDEVGYGAWAGPLVVVGTLIKKKGNVSFIKESKQFQTITDRKLYLEKLIAGDMCFYSCIVFISPYYVDKYGLYESEYVAVSAIKDYFTKNIHPKYASRFLIDGNKPYGADECMVDGDKRDNRIALSSLIAKVARDRVMMTHKLSDVYDWKNNKGYYTKRHVELVKQEGYSLFHRIKRWGKRVSDIITYGQDESDYYDRSGLLFVNTNYVDEPADVLYHRLKNIKGER